MLPRMPGQTGRQFAQTLVVAVVYETAVCLVVEAGRMTWIYTVRNPAKLAWSMPRQR